MPSTNKPSPLPLPTKPLQIKQDDKFFSKLLSKETSMTINNGSSFRIYYGDVSGSVPFTWESHPGTPKHHRAFSEITNLPPLTPPPSYFSSSERKRIKNHSRSNPLRSLLLKLNRSRKSSQSLQSSPSVSSLSFSSWSSSNSSMSAPGTPLMTVRKRTTARALSFGSSVSSKVDDEGEEEEVVSPTSVMCFGGRRSSSSSAEFVKKAWLSVVGHYGNGAN